MLIDTHAHYDDAAYDGDRDDILEKMRSARIHVVNSGADIVSSLASVELARRYDHVHATVGIHPENAMEADENGIKRIRDLIYADRSGAVSGGRIVGIGEIGLDYHYEDAPGREAQAEAFRRQLALAKELNMPVVIHSRDAAEDTWKILEETAYDGRKTDLHCYGYSAEMAERFLDMGAYFGVGGVLTFRNGRKLRESVQRLPLSHILLETDAPYLAPDPHRGERNSSLYLPLVVKALAELKGVTVEEVEEITTDNAKEFYGM